MVRATVDFLRFWSNSLKKVFLLIIPDIRIYMVLGNIHIRHTFSSNHSIHKSSCGLCFWASDPLIDGFLLNISIKESEAQKQRPQELLWMLSFDKKVYLIHICPA